MAKDRISSWVRQLRYRAKKHNLFSDITVEDVKQSLESRRCCFCKGKPVGIDVCFPLKDGAPNVPANILVVCDGCKERKRGICILDCVALGILDDKSLIVLLKEQFALRHGDVFKDYVKLMSGNFDPSKH
jgi:hypothetical protein